MPKITIYQNLTCWVVTSFIDDIIAKFDWVKSISLPQNAGKGAAILAGFAWLLANGYTHALQVDADNQHDLTDVLNFLQMAYDMPDCLISGAPIYDQSIPKSRLHGRKITNFWVAIETWSKSLTESMCGFRVYPLQALQPILSKIRGMRMDFDIEILIKAYWQGVEVNYIPTKVIYPVGGRSHFRLWRDNLRISWLHTRLFLVCFTICHDIILNIENAKSASNAKNAKQKTMHDSDKAKLKQTHWSNHREKGSIIGLKLTLWTVKLLGRHLAYLLTYPVIGYFYLFSRKARQAINTYCQNLHIYAQQQNLDTHVKPLPIFINFGKSLVDKIAVWNGQITRKHLNFSNRHELIERIDQKKGTIIFTAHLGTIEIMRAISNSYPNSRINALVFNQHAQKFNDTLSQINPHSQLSLISVHHFDMTLAMQLQQKVDQGEIIIIACDRTPVTNVANNQRTVKAEFLGKEAYFPQGGFLLAHLLKAPVYTMLCLKKGKQFDVIFKPFAESINLPRNQRHEHLTDYVQQYSDFLAEYCLKYPTQWFNFFHFWQSNDG